MPHLNALMSSFRDTQLDNLEPVPSASALDDESDIERHEYLVTISSAQRFLIAELLWFDIISCVATEAAPQSDYHRWLEETDVDVSCVTGCENWVMIAIGDIATLRAHFDEIEPSERISRVLSLRNGVDKQLLKLNSEASHVAFGNQYLLTTCSRHHARTPHNLSHKSTPPLLSSSCTHWLMILKHSSPTLLPQWTT
jgi:transcription factor-like protein